jgi:cardiolipin synthase
VKLDPASLRGWTSVPAPSFVGGNRIELLQGGDELFPRMLQAIDAAQREIWLATYIFHDDPAATLVAEALKRAAARGVAVQVVVDGFGSISTMPSVRRRFALSGVQLEVFRPLDRWYAWLQPGQLRRLHQKLCVCDETVAFVGGINLIDDRHDINHGWGDAPRLDFAVALQGPLAASVHVTARAMWARSHLWRGWRDEVRSLARSRRPVKQAMALVRELRGTVPVPAVDPTPDPMLAAFLVRDNVRQRRTIERSYVEAIRQARVQVDLAVPYFYPGRAFRRALLLAARRGVRVRLLLQGKVDYRIAAMAAQALYDEMRDSGVQIYEYTPAYLHAKVAVVDGVWATVGSSNIDPLSLLLNLEANVVVRDTGFAAALSSRLDAVFAVSTEVSGAPQRSGWRRWLHRGIVAWLATIYLRVAGVTGRY